MNGSGMPVIGMSEIAIPTFTTIWNASIVATPPATRSPNGARALVLLEERPDERQRGDGDRDEPGELPGARAREERDAEKDRDEDQARPEIGLPVDEEDRRGEEPEPLQDDERRADALFPIGEELREHDDHEHLRDLAELERQPAEADRPLRAERRCADDEDDAEEPEHEKVEERRERAEPGVIEERDGHHRREADGRPDRASVDELHWISCERAGLGGDRVGHHVAVYDEQGRHDVKNGHDWLQGDTVTRDKQR